MSDLSKRYSKILLHRGQAGLVSEPFYVDENKVALSAYANGLGLPPGARISFQEVLLMDGGRTDGSICSPGEMKKSSQVDYKAYTLCGCTPVLTDRMNYMEMDRPGWYRAVYEGPSRASVLLTAMELPTKVGSGVVKACCPIEVDLALAKTVSQTSIVTGDPGSFTITITNKGPDVSKGGSVTDALKDGHTYGLPSVVYSGGATGSVPSIQQLKDGWHYSMLPPGGRIVITVPFSVVLPASTVPLFNTAMVSPGIGETDTNWTDNRDMVAYIVTPADSTVLP